MNIKSIAIFYGHVASNVGDIAINRGEANLLQAAYPRAEITAVLLNVRNSRYMETSKASFGPEGAVRLVEVSDSEVSGIDMALDPQRWLAHCGVADADMIVLAAGEHLFSYEGNENPRNLFWRTLPAFAARQAGKACLVMPSTFGPYETKPARDLMEALVAGAPRMAARETRSLEVLRGLAPGIESWALLDPAFFIAPPPARPASGGPRNIALVMRSGHWGMRIAEDARMNIKADDPQMAEQETAYRFSLDFCRKVLDETEHAVTMFVQTDADRAIAEAVEREFSGSPQAARFLKRPVSTIDDYLEALNAADHVVASRFHALILGMVCGKPGFGLYFASHGHKIPGLMHLVGQPDHCLDLSAAQIEPAVQTAFDACSGAADFSGTTARLETLRVATMDWLKAEWPGLPTRGDLSVADTAALSAIAGRYYEEQADRFSADATALRGQVTDVKARLVKQRTELSQRKKELESERDAAIEDARRRDHRAVALKQRVEQLERSISFQLGNALVKAAKSPRDLARLPFAIWNMVQTKKGKPQCASRSTWKGEKAAPTVWARTLDQTALARRSKALSRIALLRSVQERDASSFARPELREGGILYLLHNCLPHHTGGYAIRAHGLLKGFQDAGRDVIAQARLGYPADRKKSVSNRLVQEMIDGIEYRFLPDYVSIDQADQVGYIEHYVENVLKSVDPKRVGYVHAASFFQNGLAGRMIADRLGVPLVYEMRGMEWLTNGALDADWQRSMPGIVGREMELAAARSADHVFAITHALGDWLVDNGIEAGKISVLPNGCVAEQAACACGRDETLARDLDLEGSFVVGYIGSVVFYEGIDLIVRAVGQVRKETGLDVRFLLVGDGPDFQRVTQFIDESGARDFVRQTGRVPYSDVNRYYSLVDAFVMARTELEICNIISPLKPLEALMKRKLLITSDVDAIREMVIASEGGAVTFKAGSASELSDRIVEAAREPERMAEIAQKGHQWAVEQRSWSVLARKALETLEGRFGRRDL